jgi:hypothetical protein
MSQSSLVWLGILPFGVWVSLTSAVFSNGQFARKMRGAWSARTKQELTEGSRSWMLHALATFCVILVGLFAIARLQQSPFLAQTLNVTRWFSGILDGAVVGFAIVGLALILRKHFREAQRFSLSVMVGVGSSATLRIGTLLLIVFTEELWRAVCLKQLLADGLTGPQSLILTSIAYGSTYFAWGITTALSESLVGAVLGSFFLWTNSLLVPLIAHLTLVGQIVLYALAAAPDAKASDFHPKRFAQCPACESPLSLRQVRLNPDEAFFCPACSARITISDRRRGLFRWGSVFVTGGLWIASFDILPGALGSSAAQYFSSLILMFCSTIGLWSFLQVIFPPKLECGDPYFVGLNLGDRERISRKDAEDGGGNEHES